MGTRGVIGFTSQGEHFLTYNHFDSYPDGLGTDTLQWLKDHLIEQDGHQILSPEILGALASLEQVNQDDEPDERQRDKLRERGYGKPQNVSTGRDFYAWLRDCQGDLTATLKSGFWIKGGFEFGQDGLFCEWGYVIDADAKSFDVYEGFHEDHPSEGIWKDVKVPDSEEVTRHDGSKYTHENRYKAIHRIAQFTFDEVAGWFEDEPEGKLAQAQFLSRVKKASRYPEEADEVDA